MKRPGVMSGLFCQIVLRDFFLRYRVRQEVIMRKLIFLLGLAAAVAFGGGCAGTLPTNSYTPQNIVRTEGRIDMGDFVYMPLKTDKRIKKSNQIQNTALGSIYMATDVSDFIKRGNALELEKTGVVLDVNSPIKLNANIHELMFDDLGYSVDVKYKIQYIIEKKNGNEIIFDKTFSPSPKKIGKYGDASDYANVVNDIVLAGYDMFIREQSVQTIFHNSLTSPIQK